MTPAVAVSGRCRQAARQLESRDDATVKHVSPFVPRLVALVLAISTSLCAALGADAQHLDSEVDATLRTLYAITPAAKELARRASGILVFPEIFREPVVVRVQSGRSSSCLPGHRTSRTGRPIPRAERWRQPPGHSPRARPPSETP
jgi:hypothetical protein